MIVQYTAAALATENKILAHPASVDTIPTSANVEDHVSMGHGGAGAAPGAPNVEHIPALELMAAAQGIDFRRQRLGPETQLGEGTRDVYALIRSRVPFLEKDGLLSDAMAWMHTQVVEGAITRAAHLES
jgi:histidine ammonia-lyase